MKIDPSISATPFTNVKDVGSYPEEGEILFSIHLMFRIIEVKQIEKKNNRLWQEDLTFASDHDLQLQALAGCMEEEMKGSSRLERLAQLMIKLGQFNRAEE